MKNFILKLCFYVGIIRLFAFFNRKKIVILAIHQVVAAQNRQHYRPLRPCLSTEQFQSCINILSRYYKFITLDEAVDMIKGKQPLRSYSLVLTFDDGYKNNLTHAGPILNKKGIPYIIYLTSGLIEKRIPMWVDRLDFALLHNPGQSISLDLCGNTLHLGGTTTTQKQKSFKKFRQKAKSIACDDSDFRTQMRIASELLESFGGESLLDGWETDEWAALLSWVDIDSSRQQLVSYGGHTQHHTRLSLVSSEIAELELRDSKKLIEERTKRECTHFAYPDDSYNDEVKRLVEKCGYKSAVTAKPGFNVVGTDPYLLSRLMLPADADGILVLSQVSGLLDFLSGISLMTRLVRKN